MSREIIFRGKTINGDWVFGNYAHIKKDFSTVKKGHYISNSSGSPFAYLVRPETVGQFTGLTDKSGTKIFRGDLDQNGDVVKWCDKRLGWALKSIDDKGMTIHCNCYRCEGYYNLEDELENIEVVGNIHEIKRV